jgi:uncharacterized protein YegJ (DUF2314 family)
MPLDQTQPELIFQIPVSEVSMPKKTIVLICAALIVMSCSFFDRLITSNPRSEDLSDVEIVSANDREINAAIDRAQETLPQFIQELQNPGQRYGNSMIKVRFRYGSKDSAEHMWMGKLSFAYGKFSGILADKPEYVDNLKQGDTLTVDAGDVSDWILVREDGTMLGGFTMHVFLDRMSEEERENFIQETGYNIPDEPLLP